MSSLREEIAISRFLSISEVALCPLLWNKFMNRIPRYNKQIMKPKTQWLPISDEIRSSEVTHDERLPPNKYTHSTPLMGSLLLF